MEYYTWRKFDGDVDAICRLIKSKKMKFKNVYGVPRGGLVAAVCLSHRLKIPLILAKSRIETDTLIVDDIADTGKTLRRYAKKGNIIITFYYHRQSKVIPDIYRREKKKKWIHFPWEKKLKK